MLAQKESIIEEASNTIYQLTQEEQIRLQCEAREDFYRRQRAAERRMKEREARITELDAHIAKLKAKREAAEQKNEIEYNCSLL